MLVIIFALSEMRFLPHATKLGQGYIFTGVCDSVHGGRRGSGSVHAEIPPRTRQASPQGPGRHPPPVPGRHPPRTRRSPPQYLAGTPPPDRAVHTGRYGQRAGGMHPTGMQSCLKRHFKSDRHNFFEHAQVKKQDGKFYWLNILEAAEIIAEACLSRLCQVN